VHRWHRWHRSLFPAPRTIRKAPPSGRLKLESLENRDCPNSYTVNSTLDDGSVGTLRWAVDQANASDGADTIVFALGASPAITLSGTQLQLTDITGRTTIDGPGVAVSGGGLSRVFQVDAGVSASFSGLTISGGSVTGNGGGLYNLGNTTLTDCTVTGNHAIGGIDGSTINGVGGGIGNKAGTIELIDTTVNGNTADLAGGGAANAGIPASGGGKGSTAVPAAIGDLEMTNCAVSGNSSGVGSGAVNGVPQIQGGGKGGTTVGPSGPATLNMHDCSVSDNLALADGGSLGTTDNGAGFGVANAGDARLTACTISGNEGGGIYNSGPASGGGKGSAPTAATLEMSSSTISGNTALSQASSGGGKGSTGPSPVEMGFGLFSSGNATLTNSTISGNEGGGVYNDAAPQGGGKGTSVSAALKMGDCTISGNSAPAGTASPAFGLVNSASNATLLNCTISGNDGGIYNMSGTSTTTLLNTIVAGNTTADLEGTGFSGTNNLIGAGGSGELVDGQDGNIVGTATADLHLPPLGDYGGPTQTVALEPASPAIDKGAPVVFTTLAAPIADEFTTSITVADTSGLAVGLYVQIDSEIMRITGVTSATTLTVARGQLGTTAAAHDNAATTNVTLAADQRGVTYTGTPDIGAFEFLSAATVTETDSPAAEGSGATLTYVFQRTGDISTDLPLNFMIGGSAGFTADYTAASTDAGFSFDGVSGTITIAAGSSTATVVITPVDDTIVEGDESVDLTIAGGAGYSPGSPATASGTIADNDTASITFSSSISNAAEGGADADVKVALTITANGVVGTGTLGAPVSVDLSGANGNFTFPSSPMAVFGVGAASGDSVDVPVAAVDDTIVEGTQNYDLGFTNLSDPTGQVTASGTNTLAIADNDTAALTFGAGAFTAAEGGADASVTVMLTITANGQVGTGTLGSDVAVDLAGAGSGIDFNLPTSPMAVFASGSASGSTSVIVSAIDDTIVEGPESFMLGFTNVSDPTGQVTAAGTATLDVADNDTAAITFSSPTSTATEGGADAAIGVTLTITANGIVGSGTLGSAVSVDLSGAGSGTQFNFPTSPMVSFASGSSSGSVDVDVSAVNDTLVEGTQTFNLGFTDLSDPTGQVSDSGTDALSIIDNDTATLSIEAAPTVAEQGGRQTIVVTLITSDGGLGAATLAPGVTLSADVVDLGTGSALSSVDYADFGTQTVCFGPGAGKGATQTVTIAPVNDNLVEGNETVDLHLQNLSTTLDGQASLGNADSTVTIQDNDTATLSIEPTENVAEQGGSQAIAVMLTTSDGGGGTATLAPGVTLSADVVDLGTGTATSASDYAAFGTQTISFGSGSSNGAIHNATIAPVNDTLFELNETVNLQLQNLNTTLDGQASIGNADSTATILSDDPMPHAALSIAGTPLQENGGVATVTATLDALAGVDVTITPTFSGTATLGADYTASASQIVIPAGQLTGSITLTGIDDNLDEPNETAIVGIAGITNGIASGQQQVTAEIIDNDPSLYAVAQGAGAGGATRVNVYNGDGTLRFALVPFAGWTGEIHVATGDVNDDGIHDLIVGAGAGGGPRVEVFDGASGAEIRSFFAYGAGFTGGVYVGAGDINDDGFADIITGAGAGAGPHVKVFDGQTSAVLRSFYAYDAGYAGGVTVAGGDIDRDGFADIITGSASGATNVEVFSGLTNLRLESFYATPGAGSGVFVGAGDINGDGFDDLVTGVGPQVKVFSGQNDAVLQAFTPYGAGFTGEVLVAAHDVNGDGIADIITGPGPGGGPHIEAFDGPTLAGLQSFMAFDPTFTAGVFVG